MKTKRILGIVSVVLLLAGATVSWHLYHVKELKRLQEEQRIVRNLASDQLHKDLMTANDTFTLHSTDTVTQGYEFIEHLEAQQALLDCSNFINTGVMPTHAASDRQAMTPEHKIKIKACANHYLQDAQKLVDASR